MADLHVLRKRLASIESTGSMAQAMKTIASAKYAKLSRLTRQLAEYSEGCAEVLGLVPGSTLRRSVKESLVPDSCCHLVLTSDKGFCGGFNSELLKYAASENILEDNGNMLLVCGRKGQKFLRDRDIPFTEMSVPDSPTADDARSLCEKLINLYVTGQVKKVLITYQKFVNMLTQTPITVQFLPFSPDSSRDDGDVLYLPSREAFSAGCIEECLISELYGILLSHNCACQAATLMAMKSACDNAKKSADALRLEINRIRQAEVTNSVIETSAGMAAMYSEI